MNLIAIIGNVASAPIISKMVDGTSVCTFRIAVSRVGGHKADMFTVTTTERQAELCAEYLYVGRRVGIEGTLGYDHEWTGCVRIVANRVELLGAKA